MKKKSTKFTSLLLAGASVASLVPMGAAHAADITRLEEKDGSITNAIAFADGKYIYEGYKDDEESGLYYSNGTDSKDKLIEDAEDGTIVGIYGKDSVIVEDGGDQYTVNMAENKVSDDELEDKMDDAERALEKALKKADRYDDDFELQPVTTSDSATLLRITPDQFQGDKAWFQYKAQVEDETYFGFTDDDGNYIDASHIANVQMYNGKSIKKIKEYSDADTTKDETAILKDLKPFAQDSDYIYAIATVKLNGAKDLAGDDLTGNQYYLQKISKKRSSDKEDGAYLPNSVTSYLLSDASAEDDMTSAFEDLITVSDGIAEFKENVGVKVDGNSMYVATVDSDSLIVTTYLLKNEKVETSKTADKVNVYGVFYDDDVDQEVEDTETAVAMDVDGNFWALDSGKIYESVKGKDFEKVYTCDGSFNSINVYDKNNLIVWDDDDESYSVIGGSSAKEDTGANSTTDTNSTTTSSTVKIGWNEPTTGQWKYSKDGVNFVTSDWVFAGGQWYYMGADGTMQTGWVYVNGTWYYMNPVSDGYKGSMKTGWVYSNGAWYFLQSNGAMKTGWLNDRGKWYYLNANGSMAANTVVGGYRLGADGAWIK